MSESPRVGPSPQPPRLPDPGQHKRSGRRWRELLASVVVVATCSVTVALAVHNGWGPFNTGAPLAPISTPGISSDQPSVNPSAAASNPDTLPTTPPFDAAAFQTPAFLLVKAAPAEEAVSNVLAPTLDCLAIGAATSEQITTSGGDLPLTYECAGGGLDFGDGSGVFLFGEPQVQSDNSATILAGTPMSSQGVPPIGVVADQGTGGSTWWAMPVGLIAASALQANDARCSSVSEPSACIANLFATPSEYQMEATPQFDHHYAQDLAFMYVKGYTLVPQNSWGASDKLHVLIGERPSTGGAPNEQTYFFADMGEIGIDTSNGSASITVVAHTNNEVTLKYALYNPGNSASVGSKDVRFEWTGSKLLTLDPLPPSSPSTNGSRR